jgi:hypothetical protein
MEGNKSKEEGMRECRGSWMGEEGEKEDGVVRVERGNEDKKIREEVRE